MATHSSVLAWRIPGTGEPGGLPSVGLHRVGHDWSDLAAAAAAAAVYVCQSQSPYSSHFSSLFGSYACFVWERQFKKKIWKGILKPLFFSSYGKLIDIFKFKSAGFKPHFLKLQLTFVSYSSLTRNDLCSKAGCLSGFSCCVTLSDLNRAGVRMINHSELQDLRLVNICLFYKNEMIKKIDIPTSPK